VTSEVLEAFRDEAKVLDGVVEKLSTDDLSRPTNCPPWNVKQLLVHVAIVLPPSPLRVAAASTPDIDNAADCYRRPERTTTDYHEGIADKAVEAAADLTDGFGVRRLLTRRWQTAWQDWSERDLSDVIAHSAGSCRLDDYIVTRVISHAAHGLDLALSLGRQPWTTARALAVMRPVFTSLLGVEPPSRWDGQGFFARATGRRALDGNDRAELGSLAARWPLLS
jgi:uncharacterized protein (TIGR03083 family)